MPPMNMRSRNIAPVEMQTHAKEQGMYCNCVCGLFRAVFVVIVAALRLRVAPVLLIVVRLKFVRFVPFFFRWRMLFCRDRQITVESATIHVSHNVCWVFVQFLLIIEQAQHRAQFFLFVEYVPFVPYVTDRQNMKESVLSAQQMISAAPDKDD